MTIQNCLRTYDDEEFTYINDVVCNMNNQIYINNLMFIHRELSHHITAENLPMFDRTITAAIIALSKSCEIPTVNSFNSEAYFKNLCKFLK